MDTLRSYEGFTLMELLIFITILGVIVAGLASIYPISLKGASLNTEYERALHLAQERMELIIGQRKILGFSNFNSTNFDPCSRTPPSTIAVCTLIPAGYSVTSSYTNNWNGDSNYRDISVQVNGVVDVQIQSLFANY